MYNKFIIILLSLVFGVCVGAVYAYAAVARQLSEQGFGSSIPLPIVGALASVGSYAAICNGVLVDKAGFAVGYLYAVLCVSFAYFGLAAVVHFRPQGEDFYLLFCEFFLGQSAVTGFLSISAFYESQYSPYVRGTLTGALLASIGVAGAVATGILELVAGSVKQFGVIMGVISLISGLGLVAIMQQGALPVAAPLGTSAAECDRSRTADDAPNDIELQQLVPAHRSSAYASAPEPDSTARIAEPSSGGASTGSMYRGVAVAVPPYRAEDEGHESHQLIPAVVALAEDRRALPAAELRPSHAGCQRGPCNCWLVALWLVVFLGIGSAFVVVNGISSIAQARFHSQGSYSDDSVEREGGQSKDSRTLTVAIEAAVLAFSLGNTAGRIIAGVLGDCLAGVGERARYASSGEAGTARGGAGCCAVPGPWARLMSMETARYCVMLGAAPLGGMGMLLLLLLPVRVLFLGTLLVGFCEGCFFASWTVLLRVWVVDGTVGRRFMEPRARHALAGHDADAVINGSSQPIDHDSIAAEGVPGETPSPVDSMHENSPRADAERRRPTGSDAAHASPQGQGSVHGPMHRAITERRAHGTQVSHQGIGATDQHPESRVIVSSSCCNACSGETYGYSFLFTLVNLAIAAGSVGFNGMLAANTSIVSRLQGTGGGAEGSHDGCEGTECVEATVLTAAAGFVGAAVAVGILWWRRGLCREGASTS